jgi:hypothetical protein
MEKNIFGVVVGVGLQPLKSRLTSKFHLVKTVQGSVASCWIGYQVIDQLNSSIFRPTFISKLESKFLQWSIPRE